MKIQSLQSLLRIAITLAVVAAALLLARMLWHRDADSAWTRDGRVRADVVRIAPDVSGLIRSVAVHDNEYVHRGQVLFIVDPDRFVNAVQQAQAEMASAQAALQVAQADIHAAQAGVAAANAQSSSLRDKAQRRDHAAPGVVSTEERTDATAAAAIGQAQVLEARARLGQAQAERSKALAAEQLARAHLALAQLNLARTQVRAPSDGYITNLKLEAGDYAAAGAPRMALVNSNSIYVEGYFEETKLPQIHLGDPVDIRLMAGGVHLRGTVTGIARGIASRENPMGSDLLSETNPIFDWVRLAQRIPVRIAIDRASLPPHLRLAAGMTATLRVHRASLHPGKT